jgi:transmembrane sensor
MKLPRMRVRRMFGSASGAEEAGELIDRALDRVRSADPDTGRAWSRLAVNLDGDPVRFRRGIAARSVIRLRPVLWSGLALAAAVAAIVFLIPRESERIYTTGRAQQSTVLLPDSTVVTMNHTSTLAVRAQRRGEPRIVTLEGEAYFQVKGDGTSFVVVTRAGNVEVLGTAFNVRSREEATSVEVLHGRVRFGPGGNGGAGTVILTQDQRSQCAAGGRPEAPLTMDHRTTPGWLEGQLICDRMSLSDVCRELEETYDIVITLDDPSIRGITVTGTINARSADAAVRALSVLTGHHYRQDHATFILY